MDRRHGSRLVRHGLFSSLFVSILLVGCATNPATGKRQISLYSEAQEIELGRNADQQFVAQLGLVEDEELQTYVSELGQRLAAASERPHLPWSFRVVDDPVVNAFALPGGFIFITRGILSHLSSEAELAGVLGHEIGHVTARHSINQMSKAQLAQIGVVAGAIAAPEMAQSFGNLAMQGLGVLFLKFGRDDERQADELGFRYMTRMPYPPAALTEVFGVLDSVTTAAQTDRLPNWLSTHPAPVDRSARNNERVANAPPELRDAPWHRDPYLDRVDGLVWGPNPREGFFRGQRFFHPELAFAVEFPDGWKTQNQKQAVVAVSPEQDAMMILTLVEGDDPSTAAGRFFEENEGLEAGGPWVDNRRGLPSVSDRFRLRENDVEKIRGGAAFTAYDGRVYRLLGYGTPDGWQRSRRAVGDAAASFEKVTDRRILDVEPRRLDIVRIGRSMTLREFADRHPSSVDIDVLARINHVDPDETLAKGSRVKRVVGEDPAREP